MKQAQGGKMREKIKESYRLSKNIYDDVLTQNKWWSRLYIRLFWNGVDDNLIAEELLKCIPDHFTGKLLDVPVGTAVFTYRKYAKMKRADITCLDYSADMLEQARNKFEQYKIGNINVLQGDVGALPFADETFDIVLSMNGFHAFPDKQKAYAETNRVLKKGGKFIACFYIQGRSKVTDWLVDRILVKKGWFTPPFETALSLKTRLKEKYQIEKFQIKGSIVRFCAVKK